MARTVNTLASLTDVIPTMLKWIRRPADKHLYGNSLLPEPSPRVVYFHKNGRAESWGLRDGRWKFIGTFDGESHARYALESDPDELTKLAEIY